MPYFDVNTNLGTAVIDTLESPQQVNNLLAALNLKTISEANLKMMEARAGEVLVSLISQSQGSIRKVAQEAFDMESNDIAEQESREAMGKIGGLVEYFGVCLLPDASHSVRIQPPSKQSGRTSSPAGQCRVRLVSKFPNRTCS